MELALAEYSQMIAAGALLEEADWSKVRGLEFREALEERDELVRKLEFFDVKGDDFVESVRLFFIAGMESRLMELHRSIKASMASGSWRRRSLGALRALRFVEADR